MPCPVPGNDDQPEPNDDATFRAERSRIERREFVKSALVIGGAGALSTVTGLYGMPSVAAADEGYEPPSIGERSNRQHGWDAYERWVDAQELSLPPTHHLLLHADYAGDGPPADEHRREVAAAFREIERHFAWSHDGVLFTVGYSLDYFRRFDGNLPPGIDPDVPPTEKSGLLSARSLIDADGVTLDREDPEADGWDVCIHLSGDHVEKLLAVEALLWDDDSGALDGFDVSFDATLDGILTKPDSYPERRVGFAGHDTVVERLDEDTDFDASRIPGTGGDEDDPDDADDEPRAALSMGFRDQYLNSVPRETNVTMLEDQRLVDPKPPGVFAQGTIQHVSKIDIDLARFYDENDTDERRERMFSPHHSSENTGDVGENLGNSTAAGDRPMRRLNGRTDDIAGTTVEDFENGGVVGHGQKTARARFDLESRITEEGQVRLSGGDEPLPAEERDDGHLPGHDGNQEAEQIVLRRDVDTTDGGRPGNHFVALMRFNPYMVYLRQSMNGIAFDSGAFGLTGDDRIRHDAIGAGPASGIVDYFTTLRRGNYLVPPIALRALPHPRGEEVELSVWRRGDSYVVEVADLDEDEIDPETVRFGWFYDVNRGRGASPSDVGAGPRAPWDFRWRDSLTVEFPAADTGIDAAPGGRDGDEDVRLRLFAKRAGSRRPLWGTANLQDVGEGSGRNRGRGGRERGGDGRERNGNDRGRGNDERDGDDGRDRDGRGRGDGGRGRDDRGR